MPDNQRPSRAHRVPPAAAQVGRRPPRPIVPVVTGVMWIIVGIVALATFTASWKYVVGIFAIGIGLLFLRGGLVAVVRQDGKRTSR